MKTYKTIDAYIGQYPKEVASLLEAMRKTIKKAAPKAEETITYGIPTFTLNGNLVHFGGFKTHIGFFPGASGIAAFKKKIASYKTSKGTIQFPLNKPLPLALVREITLFRVKENTAKAKKKPADTPNIKYHADGTVWAKGKSKNGILEGPWKWFRKDGTIMRSGTFKKGVQVGRWVTYDKKGKEFKTTHFGTNSI
ncbi:DUF1801 domain-containing protein [Patescibacteria group bacterium]|nr:DUF1801 domain-containing protein [Patescibacteria group bacterium]